ncbi:MAG: hypothetical protein ABI835_17795 [Chloroflexota bacterium]
MIVIRTSEFCQSREWIERWFTLVEQDDERTYLHERPRGTGDTK